jgi:hypothetical protein
MSLTHLNETITHIVLIKADGDAKQRAKIYKILSDIKSNFEQKPKDNNINSTNITAIMIVKDLENSKGFDSLFLGRLNICTDYNFAFIVHLPSRMDLENYYRDELHSKSRQKLYELINPETKLLYKQSKNKGNNPVTETSKANAIEEKMKGYILRLDFTNLLPIEYIAQ